MVEVGSGWGTFCRPTFLEKDKRYDHCPLITYFKLIFTHSFRGCSWEVLGTVEAGPLPVGGTSSCLYLGHHMVEEGRGTLVRHP